MTERQMTWDELVAEMVKYREDRDRLRDAKTKAAFPNEYGSGMTLREYAVIKLSAAWVAALSRRYDQTGYTDEYCGIESNRLAVEQADALIASLQEAGDE